MPTILKKKAAAKPAAKPTKKAPAKPLKKERGREVSMRKLMEAGIEVFAEYGFDGATTRMLSQRSGINESLINRYFEGKSGLLLAIILEFIRRERANELNYEKGQTLEKEIENYLRFHLEQSLVSRDFMRIGLSRAAIEPKIRERVNQCVIEGEEDPLEARFREFQTRGAIRKDVDLKTAARVVGLQKVGAKFLIFVLPEIDTEEEFKTIRFFAKSFSRSLAP
jgi:AcrR family transcriptional regulator